ncbi:hypothetical protein AWN68_11345 [Roseivirga echinicomitans]|uniref:Uncharacterized protein n=1 Tax=Roseivirga echinicomitans TaxID=296218 RepID=A0A150X113_9BACT|nr:hypothetical protein AWN68_11345 [Roseivirga echinicomitans]
MSSFLNDDTKVRGNDWLRKKVLPNRRIFRMNRRERNFNGPKLKFQELLILSSSKSWHWDNSPFLKKGVRGIRTTTLLAPILNSPQPAAGRQPLPKLRDPRRSVRSIINAP